MSGHAENAPDDGIAGLAGFLSDTPEEESPEQEAPEAEEQDSEEDTPDTEETESEESEDEDKTESDEEASKPQETLHKVTVKDADGNDTEIEVPQTELLKGYQRQADYTRKTQQLAEREQQAAVVVQQEIDKGRSYYLQQAQIARAAIAKVAGLRSDEEMASLAASDPAQWVQEQARQAHIRSLIGNLEGQLTQEQQRAQQEAEQIKQQNLKAMYAKSWERLSKEGIDQPKLAKVFENVSKSFGFNQKELENVYDARLVLLMRDAVAYRELKSKTPAVTKQVQKAPAMPSKNTPAASERRLKQTNERFRGGRAKVGDLASFLAAMR